MAHLAGPFLRKWAVAARVAHVALPAETAEKVVPAMSLREVDALRALLRACEGSSKGFGPPISVPRPFFQRSPGKATHRRATVRAALSGGAPTVLMQLTPQQSAAGGEFDGPGGPQEL